jgi:hypothetical protein
MYSLLELAELVLFPKRSLRRDERAPIPRQLRIVIAESRPPYEGVAVARRLYDYINDMMRNGKGKGKGKTSDFDLPYKWEDEDLDGSEDEEKELFGGIGKDLKGTVLVPIAEERVFGTKDDVQVDGAPEDLQGAWLANSNTTDRQVLLDFIKAGTDEKVVTLANPQWERVPAEMVDRYVTDTGPVELMEVRRFASERKEIEDRIWPDRD